MSVVALHDPGPLARLADVVRDPNAMSVIVQRVAEGETLKDIASAWQVPYGRLYEWVVDSPERSRKYASACHCAGASHIQEIVPIVDAAKDKDDAVVRRLRMDGRLKTAEHLMQAAPDPRDALQPEQLFDSLIAILESNPWLAARVRTALGEKDVTGAA